MPIEYSMPGVPAKYLDEEGKVSADYDQYARQYNPNYQCFEGDPFKAFPASIPSFEDWLAERDAPVETKKKRKASAPAEAQAEPEPVAEQAEPTPEAEQAPA